MNKPNKSNASDERKQRLQNLLKGNESDLAIARIIMDIQARTFKEAESPDPMHFVDEEAIKAIEDYAAQAVQAFADELVKKKSPVVLRDYEGNHREDLEVIPVSAVQAVLKERKG